MPIDSTRHSAGKLNNWLAGICFYIYPVLMSNAQHAHITRLTVFYQTADGGIRWRDTQDFGGDKSWSAEDWLNFSHAPDFVRANWKSIEVTRHRPCIQKQYFCPEIQLEQLINS
jgi:hypothetical protein